MDANELSENLKLVDLLACRIADQDGYDLVVKAVNSLLQILKPGDFPSRLLNALMDFADTTPIKKDELSPSDPILPPTLSPTMVAVQRTARAIDERTIGTGHRSFDGQSPVSHHAPPPTERRSPDGQSSLSYRAPPRAGLVRHMHAAFVPKVRNKFEILSFILVHRMALIQQRRGRQQKHFSNSLG